MIRRRFVSEMQRRFNLLAQAVRKLVVTEDAFGLRVNPMMILQADQAWRFATDSGKIDAYKNWLQKEVDAKVLTVSGTGDPWTSTYIESGYKKGVERAYIDVNKKFDFYSGSQQEFLRDAFNSPEMMSKVQLLMTRSFEELKGVTAAMSQQMGRILSDGLIKGEGPAKIARSLTDNIKKLTRTRANVIARTEIIHAHAEGQLDSFQRLNIEEVSAMVEWSTAGDDRVCEQCLSLEGETFTIEEARGQIPLHPNCRCAWMPSDMQRKTVPGKRPSGPIGAPTTKPDIITRIPTKKAPQVIPGTPKPALKTVDRHLLQLTDSLKTGVSQDYSSAFANELAVLSKKFPKVAKKLNSINIASRTGSTLADAGKVTDKLWKINLNKKYFAPTSKWDIARGLKLSVKRNLSAGKGDVSEVLTHEFGHLVNRTLSTKAKTQIESLWWKAQLDDGGKALMKALGKYANTNSSEMFSEAFVQWRAGNTNALVKKIMRLAKVKGKPGKLVGKALVEKLKTPVKITKKVTKTIPAKIRRMTKKEIDDLLIRREVLEESYKKAAWGSEKYKTIKSTLEDINSVLRGELSIDKIGMTKVIPKALELTKQELLNDILDQWFDGPGVTMIREGESALKNFNVALKKLIDPKMSKYSIAAIKKGLQESLKDAKMLNTFFDTLPKFKGQVFRGGSFKQLKGFSNLKPGMIWKQIGTVSTSKNMKIANEFIKVAHNADFDSLYILEIKTKTATDISKFAPVRFKDQLEVVLRHDTQYKILKVTDIFDKRLKQNVKHIVMQEV